MPAMKPIRRDDCQAKRAHADWLRFWKWQYTCRKFQLDYPNGSLQRNNLLKLRMNIAYRMQKEPYLPVDAEVQLSVVLDAVAYYHNTLHKNPKYYFDAWHLNVSKPILSPLLEDCGEEIAILQKLAFTYGYFMEDLWGFVPGETIVDALHKEEVLFSLPQIYYQDDSLKLPPRGVVYLLPRVRCNNDGTEEKQDSVFIKLPREFLRENDDRNWPCRFNYVDRQRVQYFEEEREGYTYLYLSTLGKQSIYVEEIERLPWYFKRSHNKKTASFGDKEIATLQVCLNKKISSVLLPDFQRFCFHAINRQRFAHGLPMTDCGPEDFFWITYGLDYEQLPPKSRAYGLWLWDLVDYQGKTLGQAMDILLASPFGQNSVRHTDITSSHRDLEHARKCIEAMNILKLIN